jgi:hypothetical protein
VAEEAVGLHRSGEALVAGAGVARAHVPDGPAHVPGQGQLDDFPFDFAQIRARVVAGADDVGGLDAAAVLGAGHRLFLPPAALGVDVGAVLEAAVAHRGLGEVFDGRAALRCVERAAHAGGQVALGLVGGGSPGRLPQPTPPAWLPRRRAEPRRGGRWGRKQEKLDRETLGGESSPGPGGAGGNPTPPPWGETRRRRGCGRWAHPASRPVRTTQPACTTPASGRRSSCSQAPPRRTGGSIHPLRPTTKARPDQPGRPMILKCSLERRSVPRLRGVVGRTMPIRDGAETRRGETPNGHSREHCESPARLRAGCPLSAGRPRGSYHALRRKVRGV